ncbi:MAG: hypothetical protein ACREIV_01180, partial [Planctomycetaceae bacterium]
LHDRAGALRGRRRRRRHQLAHPAVTLCAVITFDSIHLTQRRKETKIRKGDDTDILEIRGAVNSRIIREIRVISGLSVSTDEKAGRRRSLTLAL